MYKYSYIILAIVLISSCEPSRHQKYPSDTIHVKANLNNTNELLKLGDTLTLYLKLPSSALSSLGPVTIERITEKSFFICDLSEVDTVNKTSKFIFHKDLTAAIYSFVTKGNVNERYNCEIGTTSPYEFEISFVLKKKGVFYIQMVPQAGVLTYNNGRKAGIYVNFDIVDKHHSLLGKYFGPPFVQSIAELDQMGFGTYAFRVQ